MHASDVSKSETTRPRERVLVKRLGVDPERAGQVLGLIATEEGDGGRGRALAEGGGH